MVTPTATMEDHLIITIAFLLSERVQDINSVDLITTYFAKSQKKSSSGKTVSPFTR
jgi:hypothetical protein